VQRSVAGAVARLRKKIGSLRQQGANPESHLATQRLGDLLMANLYAIPRGAAEAVVEDWDAPGATVAIPLDPLKPAVAAAEALYAKARKQRRAVDQVAPLILEAESQLEYLLEAEVMVAQLAGHADAAALREVEADLVAGKYVKPPPGAALAAKAATKAKRATKRSGAQGGGADGYRQFESPGGLTVLVGRNSRQNDELTMRKAQPTDVWMHARGVPGAHLLLRVPAGRDAGDADLQFAANIAAFFSKSRTEGKVDITCARPADISKPRESRRRPAGSTRCRTLASPVHQCRFHAAGGAKLGQVLVKKEFVIIGKPGQSPPAVEGGAA
jgi:predicted ribosome quality control (RQC) complex YloA/Tae2 family protein